MTLGRFWVGNVFGTNTGNVFVKLDGGAPIFKGSLRHNETGVGIAVYDITGSYDGSRLSFEGSPQNSIEGVQLGPIKATGVLQSSGNLAGEWESEIGSAGTFVLFPQDSANTAPTAGSAPEQLHTARHNFGPIVIDREQIIALADDLQRGFPNGRLVVTFDTGTGQSLYLEDFKRLNVSVDRANLIKLFVREADVGNIDKSISVEFGQDLNLAMCQGASESWALGELEKLKRDIRKFERIYAAKKYGVGINQFMLVCTIVFLPSLQNLQDRAILMAGVLALVFGVNWLHNQYLPHAAIYLNKKSDVWLVRFLPSAASWLIGIMASVIATLLGAYLKGWFSVGSP